jgi:ribonucleoside-diphosphate reductase alpha chain
MRFPPHGEKRKVAGVVSAVAQVVRYRCEQLRSFEEKSPSPVLDAMFSLKEPKTGTDGTMSWTVDVYNPRAQDDFVLMLKELVLPNGQRRPYSVWMAGVYPKALDGLCKLLSYDEPLGDFMARVPGAERQENYVSTVAYVARLIIHRYAMLGVLDERGFPVSAMGVLDVPDDDRKAAAFDFKPVPGKPCQECGNSAVIRKDGCEFCTACGAIGACG